MPVELRAPVRLAEAFPDLVQPMKEALDEGGERNLAASVDELQVYALCGCGDDFCGSFYTRDPANRQTRTIGLSRPPLAPFAVGVTDGGAIAFVEVIDADQQTWAEFKQRYTALLRGASAGHE